MPRKYSKKKLFKGGSSRKVSPRTKSKIGKNVQTVIGQFIYDDEEICRPILEKIIDEVVTNNELIKHDLQVEIDKLKKYKIYRESDNQEKAMPVKEWILAEWAGTASEILGRLLNYDQMKRKVEKFLEGQGVPRQEGIRQNRERASKRTYNVPGQNNTPTLRRGTKTRTSVPTPRRTERTERTARKPIKLFSTGYSPGTPPPNLQHTNGIGQQVKSGPGWIVI